MNFIALLILDHFFKAKNVNVCKYTIFTHQLTFSSPSPQIVVSRQCIKKGTATSCSSQARQGPPQNTQAVPRIGALTIVHFHGFKFAGLRRNAKKSVLFNIQLSLSLRLYHIPSDNQTKTEPKGKNLSLSP